MNMASNLYPIVDISLHDYALPKSQRKWHLGGRFHYYGNGVLSFQSIAHAGAITQAIGADRQQGMATLKYLPVKLLQESV